MPAGPTLGAQGGDEPGPEPAAADRAALELDAERAAADHWRRIARQKADEYAALRHRPVVRALLAVERRLAPVWGRAREVAARVRAGSSTAAVRAEGVARRLGRRATTEVSRRASAPAPLLQRSLLVAWVGEVAPPAMLAPRGVQVVHVAAGREVGAALDRAIATSSPDLVAVVLATTASDDPGWLARLAAVVQAPVVAAAPLVVHPRRPLTRATPHDGRIRSAGLTLELDGDRIPVVRAVASGGDPASVDGVADVVAATAAAVVIDAASYRAAGGLGDHGDLDASVVDLLVRLRDTGGRVVLVPDAVVTDHRAVRAHRDLRTPVDPAGPGWIAAVEASGARLRRAATPAAPPSVVHLALTVAAPSAKVAARWGDWHLAHALADSLRRRGHQVRLQTADHADDLAGRACDVHLVVRGLAPVRRTTGQRHVLWIISHPEAIDDDELDAADLVLVASAPFAHHLRGRTATPVEVLLQATDHRRFRPVPEDPRHRHDVTIVAKTRDAPRPVVADALAAGLRPAIYGAGWEGLVDPALHVADHVRNEDLPVVYSSAGVVLADHWGPMRAWGFVSNRIFDVLACGAPVISDPVPGLDDLFEGTVDAYHDPDHLRALVEQALGDRPAARARAARGREIVLRSHTFDQRAADLMTLLDRYAEDA